MPHWLRSFCVLALLAAPSCAPAVSHVPLGMGPQALAESRATPAHAANEPHAPPRHPAAAKVAEASEPSVDEPDADEDDGAKTESAKHGTSTAAPSSAPKATTFSGMYAGTDIATFRFDGRPDQRQEDDKAKIRVEVDGDDAISIVIINSDTGEDLCQLSASISGKVATVTGSEPCFTNPDDDSVSAMITEGRATLKDDELKVTAEGTMSVSLPDQSLSGTLSYTFKGKRQ
jgi:uncharacterized Zn-binding protein involved in type VI secretion